MKEVFEFHVHGEPTGQPRQRHHIRKIGETFVAKSYDPGTAQPWKDCIAREVRAAGLLGLMLDCPIGLEALFIFKRPKSHFRTGKNAALLREGIVYWHISKPDMDNIVKAAKDALTDLGVWRDDSLVCRETLEKHYAIGAGPSITFFKISKL